MTTDVVNRRRLVALGLVGLLLITVAALLPSSNGSGDDDPGGDRPCFASRLGLPCR